MFTWKPFWLVFLQEVEGYDEKGEDEEGDEDDVHGDGPAQGHAEHKQREQEKHDNQVQQGKPSKNQSNSCI